MKRVLFDTNIYEFILRYLDEAYIRKVVEGKIVLVYGNSIIRKELRNIPKGKKEIVGKELKNLRITLLSLYDLITSKHSYEITEDMKNLAERYFVVYKTLGGLRQKADVIKDFVIVACATIHGLDIVVSEDNKTMRSKEAVEAYEAVNNLECRRTPDFIGFEKFKRMLGGVNLD